MSKPALLYVGKLIDEDEMVRRRTRLLPAFVAQHVFESNVYRGIKASEKFEVSIRSFTLSPSFPTFPLIFWRRATEFDDHRYLRYVNLPVVRDCCLFLSVICNILSWSAKTRSPKVIFLGTHFTPVTAGVRLASSLVHAKMILTLTDLSGFSYSEIRLAGMGRLKRTIARIYRRLAACMERSADGYVLVSAGMRNKVNASGKPDVVMEGVFNAADLHLSATLGRRSRAICHAGTLNREYGIDRILEMWDFVESRDAELWLVGSGNMDSEILSRAKRDPRIKFLGYQPRERVIELLSRAWLLVNLRDPSDEFTRYSFPSKYFEYLASGTPVLSTRLAGIPEEYFDYFWAAENLDARQLAEQVDHLLSSDEEVIDERGARGREFVLSKKGTGPQLGRVVDFLCGVVSHADTKAGGVSHSGNRPNGVSADRFRAGTGVYRSQETGAPAGTDGTDQSQPSQTSGGNPGPRIPNAIGD